MKWPLLLFFILVLPVVVAQSNNLTLLTVSELDDGTFIGGTAQLILETKPGNGAIFIDSYPLTKLDTQISTRFANQVACDLVQVDCTRFDFFYTIRANSPIVGGPSAGAATALLTAAVLKDIDLDEGTVMTGTINSGGLIGPVAGIPEKVLAAEEAGLSTVLIPLWTMRSFSNESSNDSLNTTLTVIEVSTLVEALSFYSDYEVPTYELEVPDLYTVNMEIVARQLCARYEQKPIVREFQQVDLPSFQALGYTLAGADESLNAEQKIALVAHQYFLQSQRALDEGSFYSAASFCFGANQRAREIEYSRLSEEELNLRRSTLLSAINVFDDSLRARAIETIEDLETYIIVKERVESAKEYLDVRQSRVPYAEPSLALQVARAEERFFTAQMWSSFFGVGKNTYVMNDEHLRSACIKKLAEAEERLQYVTFYFPMIARDDEISKIRKYIAKEDYPMCIFQASKTKAELELLLTNLFIDSGAAEQVLSDNLFSANQVIARQQVKGSFPILGYSYYEYAQSLQESDVFSSLLYANYALELSNLDSYFPKTPSWYLNDRDFLLLFEGLVLGVLITLLMLFIIRKK